MAYSSQISRTVQTLVSVWTNSAESGLILSYTMVYQRIAHNLKHLAGRGTECFFIPLLSTAEHDYGGLEEKGRRCWTNIFPRKEEVKQVLHKAKQNTEQDDGFFHSHSPGQVTCCNSNSMFQSFSWFTYFSRTGDSVSSVCPLCTRNTSKQPDGNELDFRSVGQSADRTIQEEVTC